LDTWLYVNCGERTHLGGPLEATYDITKLIYWRTLANVDRAFLFGDPFYGLLDVLEWTMYIMFLLACWRMSTLPHFRHLGGLLDYKGS
jgi:hypothetical protein